MNNTVGFKLFQSNVKRVWTTRFKIGGEVMRRPRAKSRFLAALKPLWRPAIAQAKFTMAAATAGITGGSLYKLSTECIPRHDAQVSCCFVKCCAGPAGVGPCWCPNRERHDNLLHMHSSHVS